MSDHRAVVFGLAASLALLTASPRAALGDEPPSDVPVVPAAEASVSANDAASNATPEPWPWRFHFSLYGWLPAAPATITVDGVSSEIPERFSRILGDMEFAGMGAFEVYKGPIGAFVNAIYYKGRDTERFQGLLEPRKIRLEESAWLLDYGASYAFGPWPLWRGADPPTTTLEPFLGGRFLNDHIRLKINAGVLEPARTLVRTTIQFNAPIVGGRARANLGKRWDLFFQGDYGGWDIDHLKETWNFGGDLGYKFKIGSLETKVFGGYRYLNVRYEDRELRIRVAIKGPLIGFGFEL